MRLIFSWILLVFVGLSSTFRLNVPRALLPFHDSVQVKYSLEVSQPTGGCFHWKSTRPDVVSVTPVGAADCSDRAEITVTAKVLNGEMNAVIFANDRDSGSTLSCAITIDKISEVKIETTTKVLFVDAAPVRMMVKAINKDCDYFSTLSGILIDWELAHSGAEKPLRIVNFMQSAYEAPQEIVALEKNQKKRIPSSSRRDLHGIRNSNSQVQRSQPQGMAMIEMKESDWKLLKTLKRGDGESAKGYVWHGLTKFSYSPKGQYAAFSLYSFKKRRSILYLVNLFSKEVIQYTTTQGMKFETDDLLFYWLSESEVMTLNARIWSGYTQYRFTIDHSTRKLDSIAVHFESLPEYDSPSYGVLRFMLHKQDYLMIQSGHALYLKPYMIKPQPFNQLRTIKVNLLSVRIRTEEYRSSLFHSFGYKDDIYCIVEDVKRKRNVLDIFYTFNLAQKEIIDGNISFNDEERNVFQPKKIGPGTFWSYHTVTPYQEGHTVIITEYIEDYKRARYSGSKYWILDLKKQTIHERFVKTKSLSKVTLYQEDSIMLWNLPKEDEPPYRNIKYKQILRTDIVPQLKSICKANLLCSEGIEKNRLAQRLLVQ